jgi:hypothetical protein
MIDEVVALLVSITNKLARDRPSDQTLAHLAERAKKLQQKRAEKKRR